MNLIDRKRLLIPGELGLKFILSPTDQYHGFAYSEVGVAATSNVFAALAAISGGNGSLTKTISILRSAGPISTRCAALPSVASRISRAGPG
jgi:hypothetical protein